MIFITGDTHIPIDLGWIFLLAKKYPNLTKNDYVIIAGDFGGCFTNKHLEYTEDMMKTLPFTILFVDGNHENFDVLNNYEVIEWNGGKVHKLFDDVIHLIRGEIYTIEGKTFLAMGGSESIDKGLRIEHESWWEDETIQEKDVENAFRNLEKFNNSVDYVITHTMPTYFLFYPPFLTKTYGVPNESEKMLEKIYQKINFKKWFFGHWHIDKELTENVYAVYHEIYLIKENDKIEKIETI